MKCVVISDTHGMHSHLDIPDGDVLVHAGDILGTGKESELQGFNAWLGALPHQHKIVIAGNHDRCFQLAPERSRATLTNAIYLADEAITIEGVKFYGSPWQPWFHGWAFNLQRGKELQDVWALIPSDTDVLITHGPPFGILDESKFPDALNANLGKHAGCKDLLDTVVRIKPKYHLFGHIHESYGVVERDGVCFVNASVNNEYYRVSNDPVVFEY